MDNFRMPDSYYERPEELMWFISCSECEWVDDDPQRDANDLAIYECCPKCGEEVCHEQDYFEI